MINNIGLPGFLLLGVLLGSGGGTVIMTAGFAALGNMLVMPPVALNLLAQFAGQ